MTRRFKEALIRVRELFTEKPGVRLTTAHAAELAGLDKEVCRALLRNLTEAGILEQGVGGRFVRRSSASHSVRARRAFGAGQ